MTVVVAPNQFYRHRQSGRLVYVVEVQRDGSRVRFAIRDATTHRLSYVKPHYFTSTYRLVANGPTTSKDTLAALASWETVCWCLGSLGLAVAYGMVCQRLETHPIQSVGDVMMNARYLHAAGAVLIKDENLNKFGLQVFADSASIPSLAEFGVPSFAK